MVSAYYETATMAEPLIYHYCCDNIDDRGWGCVFRSTLNAVAQSGSSMSMDRMIDKFGRKWIEPAMTMTVIPSSLIADTYLLLQTPDAHLDMRLTMKSDYKIHLAYAFDVLILLEKYNALVIDNGVLCYCLCRHDNNSFYILDPHTTSKNNVVHTLDAPLQFLEHCRCWMILAVKRKI